MIAGEVINDFRRTINEPNTNRFTAQDAFDYLNKAMRQLSFEVDFPEATWTLTTIPGQREYAVLEPLKILRVYIVGPDGSQMILPGTDIPTLEGDILERYDDTSTMQLGQPANTPQWLTAQPASYPYTQYFHSRQQPTTSPYKQGSRPEYYMRGGNIGIVPPPISAYTVIMDYIPTPPTVTSESDILEYPEIFMDALTFKMAQYARLSDSSQASLNHKALYDEQVKTKIRPWHDSIQATKPKKFVPITKRSLFPGRGYL